MEPKGSDHALTENGMAPRALRGGMGAGGWALLAALVVAGQAAGSWSIQGAVEPDTAFDVDGGWMHTMPDTDPATPSKLYFSVLAMQGVRGALDLPWTARINPNVAPGARLAPVGTLEVLGYLGAWKDCDRDGYVGAAASALAHYPSQLLSDATLCPEGSPHNFGGWVREFVWVTPGIAGGPTEPVSIVDAAVVVWGDLGRPGEAGEALPTCDVTPLAAGTTARSGGLLRLADCQAGFPLAGVQQSGVVAPLGLGFDDPYHPEKDCGHALNQPIPLEGDPNRCEGERAGVVEEGSGRSAATVFDCREPQTVASVRDPTAPAGGRGALTSARVPIFNWPVLGQDDGTLLRVTDVDRRLAPRVDTSGSVYDATNESFAPLVSLCGSAVPVWAWSIAGRNNFLPLVPWVLPGSQLEDARAAESPQPAKRDTDFVMEYADQGVRNGALGGFWGPTTVSHHATAQGWRSVGWSHTFPEYRGATVRRDLVPAGAVYLTFYARVGAATADRFDLPGAPGQYGAEACEGATTGVLGGWDCDSDAWWDTALGANAQPRTPVARVGETFHLRDVDCLDGTLVGGAPARASLVDAAGDACP